MLLEKYDISLKMLTEAEIEQVRLWRNDPEVNLHLFTRNEISPEQQRAWYHREKNVSNWMFLIHTEGRYVGVISFTGANWETGEAVSNIFIGDKRYWDHIVAALATAMICEFAFDLLGLTTVHSKVKPGNEVGMHFNRELGFVLKGIDDAGVADYIFCAKDFRSNRKFHQALTLLYGAQKMKVQLEAIDDEHEFNEWVRSRFAVIPPEKQSHFEQLDSGV